MSCVSFEVKVLKILKNNNTSTLIKEDRMKEVEMKEAEMD